MAGLDRRIVVLLEAEGTRNEHGEYVPGPVTQVPMWAAVSNVGSADQFTEDGTVVSIVVQFTIRWRADVAAHPVNRVSVLWDAKTFTAENVAISDERKRLISIQGISGNF